MFMRPLSASAPSIAANVCPQHAWFLNVMRVMLKSRPRPKNAFSQSGPSPIARPKPAPPAPPPAPPPPPPRVHTGGADHALARRELRRDAGFRRAAGVQRLRHRV